MSKAVHGGNIEELSRIYNIEKSKLLDFSANINPLGISSKVRDSLIDAIKEAKVYPDIKYHNLKSEISEFEEVSIENIALGNGAAESIFNLVRAVKPRKALIPVPTFSEYEEAVLSIGGEVKYYLLKEDNDFNIEEDILDYINKDIDIVFICNPNNPIGKLTEKETIVKVLEKAKINNSFVVLDESFLDFMKDYSKYSAKEFLSKYNNLVIIKSLTKIFAIPGIRIGYTLTNNKELLEEINKVTSPWNINIFAEKATIAALNEKEYISKTIEYIENEKDYLYSKLNTFKSLKVFKPSVNYIMFKSLVDMDLKEELLKKDIVIRSCSSYIGLDKSYYRIAVRTREENERVINGLNCILSMH